MCLINLILGLFFLIPTHPFTDINTEKKRKKCACACREGGKGERAKDIRGREVRGRGVWARDEGEKGGSA